MKPLTISLCPKIARLDKLVALPKKLLKLKLTQKKILDFERHTLLTLKAVLSGRQYLRQ